MLSGIPGHFLQQPVAGRVLFKTDLLNFRDSIQVDDPLFKAERHRISEMQACYLTDLSDRTGPKPVMVLGFPISDGVVQELIGIVFAGILDFGSNIGDLQRRRQGLRRFDEGA